MPTKTQLHIKLLNPTIFKHTQTSKDHPKPLIQPPVYPSTISNPSPSNPERFGRVRAAPSRPAARREMTLQARCTRALTRNRTCRHTHARASRAISPRPPISPRA